MASPELTQYLQFQAQEVQTGCITVTGRGETESGRIYMHHGNVVYAETGQERGLVAFFIILTWPEVTLDWNPDQFVSTIAFNEPVDTLLFQFAQIEDTGQADPISLISLFGGSSATGEIKLTELKNFIVSFEVLNAEYHGMTFTLEKPVTLVGRSEDCDIVLPDPTVTSHHCTINQEANCIRICDLGSTNGTYINGKLISNAILQVGDDLFVGQVGLRMSMKMQRRLASQRSVQPNVPHHIPIAPPPQQTAPKNVTTSVNVDAVRQKLAEADQPPHAHEAITWKSIEEEASKTKTGGMGSIIGRIFKK